MTNIHSEEVSIESVQLVVDYDELAKSLNRNKHFMKKIKNSMQYRAQNEAWDLVVKELGSHGDVKKMVKDYLDNRLEPSDELRAVVIEELPNALNMLFADLEEE